MKDFFKKYNHIWVALYAPIYLTSFFWLEKTVTDEFYLIHTTLDEKIPFIEYFIVPYLLWFAYVAVFVVYFFFKDQKEFYQLAAFLISGMTFFLIISFIIPNGLMLRPTSFARDNIFVDICKGLWKADTATNVFPSIHVYNSIAIAVAVAKSKYLKKVTWLQISSAILATLIILSTMFLKQHSVIDVIGGIVLAAIVYPFVYMKKRKIVS